MDRPTIEQVLSRARTFAGKEVEVVPSVVLEEGDSILVAGTIVALLDGAQKVGLEEIAGSQFSASSSGSSRCIRIVSEPSSAVLRPGVRSLIEYRSIGLSTR